MKHGVRPHGHSFMSGMTLLHASRYSLGPTAVGGNEGVPGDEGEHGLEARHTRHDVVRGVLERRKARCRAVGSRC